MGKEILVSHNMADHSFFPVVHSEHLVKQHQEAYRAPRASFTYSLSLSIAVAHLCCMISDSQALAVTVG